MVVGEVVECRFIRRNRWYFTGMGSVCAYEPSPNVYF